jgi:predicted DCC family thiol-disulfide oxidoreductase YuxK
LWELWKKAECPLFPIRNSYRGGVALRAASGDNVSVVTVEATPSPAEQAHVWIFYDGACGLCHAVVRFVLRRDANGELFRFAPLQGETFGREVVKANRPVLPDSVVVKTVEGHLLVRSEAIVFVLRQLGRPWRVAAAVIGLVPSRVLDLAYRAVARWRNRLFPRPAGLCPVVPEHWRSRFAP